MHLTSFFSFFLFISGGGCCFASIPGELFDDRWARCGSIISTTSKYRAARAYQRKRSSQSTRLVVHLYRVFIFSRRPVYDTHTHHSRINRNARRSRHFKKICSCWQKMDGEIAPTNAVTVWKIQKKYSRLLEGYKWKKPRKRRVYVEMYQNGRNICGEETGACFFRGGYHPSETDGTVFPFWEMETDWLHLLWFVTTLE